ncbi:MAG: proline dehydrogenase, partial [Prevotella sp.]
TNKKGSKTDYKKSYAEAWESEFKHARDWNQCRGEQNVFRYLPVKGGMALRLFKGDTDEQAQMIALAAKICGTPLTISFDSTDDRSAALADTGATLKKETLAEFIESMPSYERIRTCSANLPKEMYERAAATNKYIATAAPVKNGRVELINYIKEQSISFEYHRYGSGQHEAPAVE